MKTTNTTPIAVPEILDLVAVQPQNLQETFSTPGAILPLLDGIAERARSFVTDASTGPGRKDIASLAAKIAKAKTMIDGMGKDLVDNLKDIPKRVDSSRKLARDFLDSLKDEIRRPLTDWEDEQRRVVEAKAAEEAAEKQRQEIETLHELALFMNVEFDRKQAEAEEAVERERLENEARIARQAVERARRESEERSRKEREASVRRESEAKVAQQRAEQQKAEAESRAKEAEDRAARERIAATEREAQARRQATEQERKRREEEERRAAADKARREANVRHRAAILVEVEADLGSIGVAFLDKATAAKVANAIAEGRIRHTLINF